MMAGFWQPGAIPASQILYAETTVQDALDAQAATQTAILSELDANYRVESRIGNPLPPVSVPSGSAALYPIPTPTPAPATWRPEFWALVAGVIVGTNDLAGVYEAAASVSFSDNAGSATIWTWSMVRGRDLATAPVIAERLSAPAQISMLAEPDAITVHGIFEMPSSGLDFEIGLFAAHDKGVSVNVTIQAMSLTMEKIGNLDQLP